MDAAEEREPGRVEAREPVPDWRELAGLAGDPSRVEALVRRCLESLCRRLGAPGAALYVQVDGGFRREGQWGTGSFPLAAAEPRLAALGAVEVPGGRLVVADAPAGAAGGVLASPWGVLLGLAARLLSTQHHLKRHHFEARYRGVELEALYDVGLAVSSTLDLDRLGEEILIRAVSLLDARRGAVYLLAADGYRLQRALGGSPPATIDRDEPLLAELLAGRGSRRSELWPEATHLLVAPVELRGEPRGLIVVADRETRRGIAPFRDTDHRTLTLFAHQAATALENARRHREALEKERLERELELAAEIQAGILPKRLPEVEGLELVAWSRAARWVGGDYYDVLGRDDGGVVAVVGDVVGKGVGAALLVSTLHSALHLLAAGRGLDGGLFRDLNRYLVEAGGSNRFATLLAVDWPAGSDRLRFLNAGHNPGILLRSGGGVDLLRAESLPLGAFPGGDFELREVELGAGDLLCLYSDGITEQLSPSGEQLGEAWLVDVLAGVRQQPLERVGSEVERRLEELGQGRPREDDQTLVLLRRS